MAREKLSTDYMPAAGENEGIVSWDALRIGMAAIEAASEVDVRTAAEIEAFMNEQLVIVIFKDTDKNAVEKVPVGVNGESAWLPRDVKIRIPRKFVERLARAQEAAFRTEDNPDRRMDEGKVIRRTNGQIYPHQVLSDPNPRGQAWHARVTREG